MNIRRVKPSDINAFTKLYMLSYAGLEEYAYAHEGDVKDYFKWLFKRDPEGFLIAELNEPVAFAACDANWFSHFENEVLGELHELFVHPNYRRRGIGSMLIEETIRYARERDRRVMGLWVGVKNLPAKEFYRKRGFTETITLGKWTRMIRRI